MLYWALFAVLMLRSFSIVTETKDLAGNIIIMFDFFLFSRIAHRDIAAARSYCLRIGSFISRAFTARRRYIRWTFSRLTDFLEMAFYAVYLTFDAKRKLYIRPSSYTMNKWCHWIDYDQSAYISRFLFWHIYTSRSSCWCAAVFFDIYKIKTASLFAARRLYTYNTHAKEPVMIGSKCFLILREF